MNTHISDESHALSFNNNKLLNLPKLLKQLLQLLFTAVIGEVSNKEGSSMSLLHHSRLLVPSFKLLIPPSLRRQEMFKMMKNNLLVSNMHELWSNQS